MKNQSLFLAFFIWAFFILAFFIFPIVPATTFDDTVFGESSLEDLDLDTSKKKRKAKPKMTLEPDLIDERDLPVVDQPSLGDKAQPIKLPRERRPEPRSDEIVLSPDEGVGDTSDLDVVQVDQLNWKQAPLKPEEEKVAAAPQPEIPEVIAETLPEAPVKMALKPEAPPAYVIPEMTAESREGVMKDGANISAYLYKIPTADAIKAVATAANEKAILPHDIPGDVTLDFKDRNWMWVVDTILKSKHYFWTYHDNILVVHKDNLKAKGPVQQAIFKMKYALADHIYQKIKPFLSKKGSALGDNESNVVIVSDIPPVLTQIAGLIDSIDVPQKTVVIDTKVVATSKGVISRFGLNESISRAAQSYQFNLAQIAKNFGLSTNASLSDLLTQLSRTNQANVVSAPRVVTLNNKDAKYASKHAHASKEQTGNIIDDETMIQITPRIVNPDWVELTLLVNHAFARYFTNQTLTRKIASHITKTTVMVRNGETALISGLISAGQKTAPGEAPETNPLDHLLIFVTPHFEVASR